jgi:hypothetical protein
MLTTQEIITKKQEILAKIPDKYRTRYIQAKLFIVKKNTGYRGFRWFDKNEYGLGYTRVDGSVSTFSFHYMYEYMIRGCILPNGQLSFPLKGKGLNREIQRKS